MVMVKYEEYEKGLPREVRRWYRVEKGIYKDRWKKSGRSEEKGGTKEDKGRRNKVSVHGGLYERLDDSSRSPEGGGGGGVGG